VIAAVDGLSLYSALRTCFLYEDRKSRGLEIASSTLDYSKWELSGIDQIHDIVTCGLVWPSLSQVLSTDAFDGNDTSGIRTRYRQLLAVGKHPMASFYVIEDQSSFTTAVSLASTVATKLTSAVYSLARTWWGGTSKEEEVEPPKVRTETPLILPINSYLSDPKRLVDGITLDPMGQYAALTDNLGRVLLLDVPRRQMLRMWKGYRNGQCAWLWVEQPPTRTSSSRSLTLRPPPPTHKQTERTMPLFLVIYAPRRGILEVWHTRHGSRIGILNVGVGGRLLTTTCPLGSNLVARELSPSQQTQRIPFPPRCFLLLPSGRLVEITIRYPCS